MMTGTIPQTNDQLRSSLIAHGLVDLVHEIEGATGTNRHSIVDREGYRAALVALCNDHGIPTHETIPSTGRATVLPYGGGASDPPSPFESWFDR